MSKCLFLGGLLAVGLTAGPASAQFVTPFSTPGPYSYGAVYPTPSGGIVQQQSYADPFSGSIYSGRSYTNPFTGRASVRESYANAYTGVVYNQRFARVTPITAYPFGNPFNNTPYLVTPSYGPWGQTLRYSPLPVFRR